MLASIPETDTWTSNALTLRIRHKWDRLQILTYVNLWNPPPPKKKKDHTVSNVHVHTRS